jgi:dTDP-4-amino-4,6-dideoxygalactose transaminase
MTAGRPAILGGAEAFPDGLPLVRPTIPDIPALGARLQRIVESGMLTNGPTVRELEEVAAERLEVPHVVAVSSCTSGLMLVLQALGATGRVVLPSFTFAASAHAVQWAGGTPVWAEIDPERLTLDPTDAARVIDGAVAMTATHVYGAPCQVEALQSLADAAGIPLVYDAAHALGSAHGGRPVGGFGAAEVFSMSPTKVATAGEGGLVATHDPALAETLRLGRDYGNPGDYDCRFVGLNARLSELHAAVGLASLCGLDERIAHRNRLVQQFVLATSGLAGLSFQRVPAADLSTYKDLTLILGPEFGLDPAQLAAALKVDGIDSRRYYYPPIHRQKAYAQLARERELPITDRVADRVLTVPLWSHLTAADVQRLADAVIGIQQNATAVAAALA